MRAALSNSRSLIFSNSKKVETKGFEPSYPMLQTGAKPPQLRFHFDMSALSQTLTFSLSHSLTILAILSGFEPEPRRSKRRVLP